jgi:hypothetical protein
MNISFAFFYLMAIFYCFFSFAAWDINPGEWHFLVRVAYIIIAPIGSGYALAISIKHNLKIKLNEKPKN